MNNSDDKNRIVETIVRSYTDEDTFIPILMKDGLEAIEISSKRQKERNIANIEEDTDHAINFYISKGLAELRYNWLFEEAIKDLENHRVNEYIPKMFILLTLAWGINKYGKEMNWPKRARLAAESLLTRPELKETIDKYEIFKNPARHFEILQKKEPEIYKKIISDFQIEK
ncbi:MAG: hypothetical protein V1845_00805 [bacterium]